MSFHGKLQTLKNGKADAEIQHWAYLELIKESAKELTDDQIEKVFQEATGFTLDCDAKVDEVAILDFARALLRKESEK